MGFQIDAAAAAAMRAEIERAGGNEVCFVATLADGGVVIAAHAVARGHDHAVLAAVRDAEPGQLVLHNHPSGELTPSAADLELAAELYERGLGLGIIDNAATRLYVVVVPAAARSVQPIDVRALAAALAPGGMIAAHHPGYEDRPTQREFAVTVAEAYNHGGVVLAEAGTGTGKSIAYLLPAVWWSLGNRERTIVSTNTINLQEQLVSKDLPFLQRALGQPFRFALVKGRRNYISIRRARLAQATGPALFDEAQQRELDAIMAWLDNTRDGSLQDLAFTPSPEVWDEVASESDVCMRARCPHFEACHYQQSRRAAATADVLVVNHHLLFSDLAVRRAADNYTAAAVLPPYARVVLDEAHNIEDAATSHLGAAVSRRGMARLLARLERRGRGVLPALEAKLRAGAADLIRAAAARMIDSELRPRLERAREHAATCFDMLAQLAATAEDGVLRLADDFTGEPAWIEGPGPALENLLLLLDELARWTRELHNAIHADARLADSLAERLLEVHALAGRLADAANALRMATRPGSEAVPSVRWIERRGGAGTDGHVALHVAPIEIGELLRDALYDRATTTILTSATLTTRGRFDFLRDRLGLRQGVRVTEACFPSPFDFETQTRLLVPTDVPDVADSAAHNAVTAAVIEDFARCSDGGLFALFTSHRAMRGVAGELRRRGAHGRWPLFVQGEAPRAALLRDFTASGYGVLLGVASFWEGVDVPGEPLRGLVIAKLPFKVPTEPLTAARIDAIEKRGGNSFREYMLPHAALRLKQGFGRLIRSRLDRGAVVILDRRILERSYGGYVLRTIPVTSLYRGAWAQLRDELRAFYHATVVRPKDLTGVHVASMLRVDV